MIHYDSYVINEPDEEGIPAGTCGAGPMQPGLLTTTAAELVTCPDCLEGLRWRERWCAMRVVPATADLKKA